MRTGQNLCWIMTFCNWYIHISEYQSMFLANQPVRSEDHFFQQDVLKLELHVKVKPFEYHTALLIVKYTTNMVYNSAAGQHSDRCRNSRAQGFSMQ